MLYMGWLLILDPKLFKCLLYRLDETAIPEWHEGFLQDCPSGKLKLETFLSIWEDNRGVLAQNDWDD